MKKTIAALLIAVMTLSLAGCAGSGETESEETAETTEVAAEQKYEPEVTDVKVSYFSFCGDLHQFIADDKGYLAEEGLNVEEIVIDSDMFTALDAGTTDVLLTYSTIMPLAQIANGSEYTIFAGTMAQGGTPLFTLEETEYNGLEDLVGKTIGTTANGGSSEGLLLKKALEEAGYNLEKDFEWKIFNTPMEAIEGVKNGEFDYAFCQTGYETVRAEYGMKDVWYPDDYEPMYSCCRILARTEWVEENPNTVKALLRAYMKAQAHFEEEDYFIPLMMEKLDQEQEKVEGYMLNPHYVIHLDPLKKSILMDWDLAMKYGAFENANNIDISEHINTELYKEVLDDLTEENPDDEYYQDLQATYAEYNENL